MKLAVEQAVFTFGDRFNIYNEKGEVKYTCEGEVFTFGKKLHIYNMNNEEVAYIEQQLLTFFPTFNVFINGQNVAEIKKEISFLTPRYYVYGLDWNVDGEFFAHDYYISRNNEKIIEIHKEWFTFGDCYMMDINDDYDEVLALSVCLAIDACISQARSHNH